MLDALPGFAWPVVLYALVLLLNAVVPGRWVDGYVLDPRTGKPLRYHLNGLRVYAIVVALYALAGSCGWLSWDVFWVHRWEMAASACVIGLIFTFIIVLGAPRHKGLAADLYLGRLENPQWGGGRIDAKMYLYLVGAIMLELNVLSFAAHHHRVHAADPSPGVVVYATLFSFFIAEYLNFERVHLYTYDFLAERVGFKLGWGCLVFYPFFYVVGLWWVAERPNPHTPTWALAGSAALFVCGWMLSRGANLQKFLFKTRPDAALFGFIRPETIGDERRQLLCSGFWRVSRHVNYLGEILMALGLALSLGWPGALGPWLYPLYYLVLLLPRQIDDDRRCAVKYGALWQRYCERVPYRIVPWIY
jgi:delta14-sterol reductase